MAIVPVSVLVLPSNTEMVLLTELTTKMVLVSVLIAMGRGSGKG